MNELLSGQLDFDQASDNAVHAGARKLSESGKSDRKSHSRQHSTPENLADDSRRQDQIRKIMVHLKSRPSEDQQSNAEILSEIFSVFRQLELPAQKILDIVSKLPSN